MINTGLGTFETSEQEVGSLYNQTRTGFWESAGATFYNAWNYNPTSSLFRAVDQTEAYQTESFAGLLNRIKENIASEQSEEVESAPELDISDNPEDILKRIQEDIS